MPCVKLGQLSEDQQLQRAAEGARRHNKHLLHAGGDGRKQQQQQSGPKQMLFGLKTAYLNKVHRNLGTLLCHFQMRNFDSSQTGI